MATSLGIVIASSISSGTFALLGVALSDRRARRRERDAFARETAVHLAEMERHVWGTSWTELQASLQQHEIRMSVASVPESLVQAFNQISVACWRALQRSIDQSGGDAPGISTYLLDARRSVHRAIHAHLLGDAQREPMRIAAENAVEDALSRSK